MVPKFLRVSNIVFYFKMSLLDLPVGTKDQLGGPPREGCLRVYNLQFAVLDLDYIGEILSLLESIYVF